MKGMTSSLTAERSYGINGCSSTFRRVTHIFGLLGSAKLSSVRQVSVAVEKGNSVAISSRVTIPIDPAVAVGLGKLLFSNNGTVAVHLGDVVAKG